MEYESETLGLHERRRRRESEKAVNFSQIRRPCPSVQTENVNQRFSAIPQGNMTPPETPMSANANHSPQSSQSALFHNYLRAFCHFDQPASTEDGDDGLLMTVSIRPGDLILVHSVHKNGWADGTVLTTGARGWLPTNYCESFDHPYLRNLLNAMTQFWDLLGAGEDANLSPFVRQDYIRGLIAGVRYLLERADCLHRDAALVQRNAGIRRMRKGLLADLSTLVQIAKRLQDTISESFAGEVVHMLLDDLVTKAFRVVTRAVGFADLLAQENVGTATTQTAAPSALQSSPSRRAAHEPIRIQAPPNTAIPYTIDSAIAFPLTPVSDKNASASSDVQREQQSDNTPEAQSPRRSRPVSGMLTHRVSVVAKRDRSRSGHLASDHLSRAHDDCISHIGAFIGLYLHSRPSSELVATSERLVRSCERLLSVVDQVTSRDSQNTAAVLQARVSFQCKLDELTRSTRDVFKFSDGPDDDIVMLPEQTTHLVNVGTSLIRTVGECVIKTRKLIEQVGDFELDQPLNQSQEQSEAGAQSSNKDETSGSPNTTPVRSNRLSAKPLPARPVLRERAMTTIDGTDFPLPPASADAGDSSVIVHHSAPQHKSLPPPPKQTIARDADATIQSAIEARESARPRVDSSSPVRKVSVGTAMTSSTDTHQTNARDSGFTAVSEVSTRATTPDHTKEFNSPDAAVLNSFGSLTSLQSVAKTDESSEVESQLLQKTYAHELTLNKDGHVTGGSLPALVEQLTTHDAAPDRQFVSAFFLTFRSFTTPRELAQTLLQRFEYVGESKSVGTPVRLRIYNVFKGWLEIYWNSEADRDALGDIRYFALHKLKPHLPQAGERLIELTRKVTNSYSTGVFSGPLVSGVGKVSMSIGSQHEHDRSAPEPIISKSQLAALRNASTTCHSNDFDPLETARQLTILASKTFCEIQPEELLSLDWSNKNTTKATHVREMCMLNTDLAHVVGDTILAFDDAKKRALVIKHWSKVAWECLALNNYESLMAIMCSLNSSVVQRLKRTWEVVSKKTKARLDELNSIVDFSRNHASLRRRLEEPVAPCLPFLGVYLTDITFVDAGNPKLRELPGTTTDSGEPMQVINFDKHMRMAKIVSHLQKFQVPYKLQPIPELQTWMQEHLARMRASNTGMVGHLHRRSLLVEPKDLRGLNKMMPEGRRDTLASVHSDEQKDGLPARPKTSGSTKTVGTSGKSAHHEPKFELFMKAGFAFRSRSDLGTAEAVEQK